MAANCNLSIVVAGLDPAIHVLLFPEAKTWTPGTSPGVTVDGEV